MDGVFDRLQKRIDDKRKEGGISVLDLADLPPSLRKIMKLMLRQVRMDYIQLSRAMEEIPEDQRLSRSELDYALQTLSDQAWLIQIGKGEHAVYKVNLRSKAGSAGADSVWQALDAKLKK